MIFRGQADATWQLDSSVLRKEANHQIYSLVRNSTNSEDRICAEILALNRFAEYCDSAGLQIPGDSVEFRTRYLNCNVAMDEIISHRKLWPAPDYFMIMALAQHYGLPTRLLDWSYSSYVAAYFAASTALRKSSIRRFAVWALNIADVTLHRLKNVEIVPVPSGGNANMAAQSGVFTLLRQKYLLGKPFTGPDCLDDYVVSIGTRNLAKVTVPISEARKVLYLCELHGITAAKLYPDFYGAANATLDWVLRWSGAEWSDGRDIEVKKVPGRATV